MINRQGSEGLPGAWQQRPIALRPFATILAVLLCAGWTRQERGYLDRLKNARVKSSSDSFITLSCPSKQVKCHYPATFVDPEWTCVVDVDADQDGRVESNKFVYGKDAEAIVLRCRNPQ